MLIDWFTVGAQAVNFLVLVWLLRRFLYKPVLRALDEREKLIAARLADAEVNKVQALAVRDEYRDKTSEFDRERGALLKRAVDEADAEYRRLVETARQAAVALKDRQAESLREHAQSLGNAITRRAQEEVLAIAKKALADLAGASLEERIVEVFIRKLSGIQNGEGTVELRAVTGPLTVRTAFEVQSHQQRAIESIIKEKLAATDPVRYEVVPDLISGIEITANGYKIAWSIDEYLKSLTEEIDRLLAAHSLGQSEQPNAALHPGPGKEHSR